PSFWKPADQVSGEAADQIRAPGDQHQEDEGHQRDDGDAGPRTRDQVREDKEGHEDEEEESQTDQVERFFDDERAQSLNLALPGMLAEIVDAGQLPKADRSEEHTSELQ